MFKGIPDSKHGEDQGTRNFRNIEDFEVPRFCEIFRGILMSRNKIYFENIAKGFLEIRFWKDCFF